MFICLFVGGVFWSYRTDRLYFRSVPLPPQWSRTRKDSENAISVKHLGLKTEVVITDKIETSAMSSF